METVPPIAVRPATDQDARAVLDLLDQAGLEAAFDPAQFRVAVQGRAVVACARLRPLAGGAFELASVAVAAPLRGRGIGERVVRAALEDATGTVYALALAPAFFERLGFAPILETPDLLLDRASSSCASTSYVPMAWNPTPEAAVTEVRRRYGSIAVARAREAACCGTGAPPYSAEELASLPEGAHLGLGTGNPVAAAQVGPGETVVDLGSGAGVDVFLAARAVGPSGVAIGIDFTPEMIARAREIAAQAGLGNVRFVEAPIEHLPLPDASVDAITSNCVINLSVDKLSVLREAFRILKPGGRFVVSDTLRVSAAAPGGAPTCDCTTGALTSKEWMSLLAQAGFVDASVEVLDDGAGGPVGRALVRARRET